MIDSLEDFVRRYAAVSFRSRFEAGDIYCPTCGGPRRVRVTVHFAGQPELSNLREPKLLAKDVAPLAAEFTCVQCKTRFDAFIFVGPEGAELAVFPSVRGGLTTPNTPPGVAYYLDQARRAQSAGANSAAVAMFRAALEHLLFQQGFTDKMLGPKISALKTQREDGTAPRWAMDLDDAFLEVIGKLGNAAIHPGDGDVEKQNVLDGRLIQLLTVTFSELLIDVYELERQTAARLNELQGVLESFTQDAPEESDAS